MELADWIKLVFQYGSFAFAVLFCIVLTRWGYGIYQKACSRKDPPASEKEKNTYRIYFLSVAFFGIILVVVSTIFWIVKYKSWYVYEGVIKKLKEHEKITSSDLYLQKDWMGPLGEGSQIRDEYFIVIQNEPFTKGQKFKLNFSKGGGRWDEFPVEYIPGINPEYSYEFSLEEEKTIFRLTNPPPKPPGQSALLFIGTAYALESDYQARKKSLISLPSEIESHRIEVLQDERTHVWKKIDALDYLNELNDDIIRIYLEVNTPKEPMVLTLLDLSRHTDKELAYKARRLINKRIEIDPYLAEKLMSNNREDQREAEKVLFRIEKWRADRILNYIPESEDNPRVNSLREEIQHGQKTKVLIPTASSTGDRYYVKAEWDPEDEDVLTCLTKLFNRRLIHDRTLEQEYKIMRGRDKRWVYDESKEWALFIAREIEKCGGNTSFVRYRYAETLK